MLACVVPGSSAVEQPAVNRLVAGSNPARGAKLNQGFRASLAPSREGPNLNLATFLATTRRFRQRPAPRANCSPLVQPRVPCIVQATQLWPRAGRAVLTQNADSETGEITSREESSLSSHTRSPVARASGLSRSRRFNSRAASVSAPEWLRNRQGEALGSDMAQSPPLKYWVSPDIRSKTQSNANFLVDREIAWASRVATPIT